MIPRQAVIDAIGHETEVCRHLWSKIEGEGFDWSFSEHQRSTLDLLRYLATCAIGPVVSMYSGDWKEYGLREESVRDMSPEEFPDAMERQFEEFRRVVEGISDEDLAEKIVRAPGAGELPLGVAIMRTSYAWMVAYRHELFLRAKGAGNMDINTANNWVGVDRQG